jgi:hypothetical protein
MLNGISQSWLRTKATGLEDYKKTMELKGNTSNSTVFADNKGNIAYWHGNYIPIRDTAYNWSQPVDGSIAATEIAISKGYQQVLWLDAVERRYVDEVGAMNIAFLYEGKHLRTPALSGAILHGVTRDSVLTLAKDLGLTTAEERIDFHEVLADIQSGRITEVFGMGTGAVIAPVARLGYEGKDILINGGEPGPVARRLFDELTGIQYGRLPDRHGWTRTLEV